MIIEKAFTAPSTPAPYRALWQRMKRKRGLVGRLRPWAFWAEITRGCNLRCGFCATRTFAGEKEGEPKFGSYKFMTEQSWRDMLNIIRVVAPRTRLEIGQAGEPSLHPQIVDFMRLAREICPQVQTLVYTNGTTLMSGRRTYKELFDAGLNILYVDMYHPLEKHVALVEKAGYDWVFEGRHKTREEFWSPFTYRAGDDPNFHMVNFCRNPGNWEKARKSRHGFYTFLNHLDWRAAEKYGLTPLTEPLKRRCDFPSKFPSLEYSGRYLLCCTDYTGETAGMFGSVADGVEGFLKFWLGEHMQRTRQLLYEKNRAAHPICAKCNCVGHRGDISFWPMPLAENYWDGETWKKTRELGNGVPQAETKPVVWMPGKADKVAKETRAGGARKVDALFDDGALQLD